MNTDSVNEEKSKFHYPISVILGVIFLSVLSLFLVVNQVSDRLTLKIPSFGESEEQELSRISLLEQEEAQLRDQDSDSDGLTDYQELKVYGSSPFISDSDSDGIPDAVEVGNNTDPNCPEGQNCFGPAESANNSTNTITPEEEQIAAIVSDPAQIRRLLIESGLDPAIVNQADDQSLQILAQEALNKFNDPTDEIQALIDGLTIDNVRDFFVSIGIEGAEIDSLSNEELLELARSILIEQIEQ